MRSKKIAAFVMAVLLAASSAAAQELIPGGQALGIRMTLDGVMVAGVSKVGERSPAEEAGIEKGDILTRLGNREISCADDVNAAMRELDGEKIAVTLLRQGKEKQVNITPAQSGDGSWKLGLWLRDGISGIGTLTFFDPASGVYGALGHSISDGDTGAVLPIGGGDIYDAEIADVAKGVSGAPGALEGHARESEHLGDIRLNCGCGIFGAGEFSGTAIETGEPEPGKASIYCTVSGDSIGEYAVEIRKVFPAGGYTCAVVTVTDPALLEATGGIVQGMSGSPILQNGRLVGAVTHVFVNDPTSGYAIGIYDMLEAAKTCDKAA